MTYENIKSGIFLSRPNRFIAHVEIGGKTEICHVKNTGRCKELLVPNATVLVQELDSARRSTKYDLISVYEDGRLINMDSQAPNKVFREWDTKKIRGFTMFFGDIVAAFADEACLTDGKPDPLKIEPIIMMGFSYCSLKDIVGRPFSEDKKLIG